VATISFKGGDLMLVRFKLQSYFNDIRVRSFILNGAPEAISNVASSFGGQPSSLRARAEFDPRCCCRQRRREAFAIGSFRKVGGERRDREEDRPASAARNRSALAIATDDQVARATNDAQSAPPQQRGRRAMEFFCGLDVGMDETAMCVVDDKGQVMLEVTVVTDPDAIKLALKPYLSRLRRVGHEAGALSPWLHPELLRLGLPAVCLETFHVRAALKAQRNKTDKTDALGIAHIMRTGWFRKAHIKSEACYRLRLLLTHRRNLKRKFLDLENAVRRSLKALSIRLSHVGRGGFAQAVREAVAGDALVTELIDAMLSARAALWKEYCRLHDLVVKLVASHELCRRFMQIPGVGPVAALSFVTAIDDPARFKGRAMWRPILA
jgi:transposase